MYGQATDKKEISYENKQTNQQSGFSNVASLGWEVK